MDEYTIEDEVSALRFAVELSNGQGGGYSPDQRVKFSGVLLFLLGKKEKEL